MIAPATCYAYYIKLLACSTLQQILHRCSMLQFLIDTVYSFTAHNFGTVMFNVYTHLYAQVRETEQLLITLWDATFAPPIDLPGFIYHKGIAARKKLIPIIQVHIHKHLSVTSNFSVVVTATTVSALLCARVLVCYWWFNVCATSCSSVSSCLFACMCAVHC
jgi:hypothetical protein